MLIQINVLLSLSNGSEFGKNIIIFGADMSPSIHIDNKKKYILIRGKDPPDYLSDAMLTAEQEYSINFTEHQKKFALYWGNSYIFANGVEIYKFKLKDSEINAAP